MPKSDRHPEQTIKCFTHSILKLQHPWSMVQASRQTSTKCSSRINKRPYQLLTRTKLKHNWTSPTRWSWSTTTSTRSNRHRLLLGAQVKWMVSSARAWTMLAIILCCKTMCKTAYTRARTFNQRVTSDQTQPTTQASWRARIKHSRSRPTCSQSAPNSNHHWRALILMRNW